MIAGHVEDLQAVKLVNEDSKRSGRFLAIPMQEPGIGLTNDQIRCAPAWLRKAKQSDGLRVPLVVAVQEGNEDSRV